MDLLYKNKKRFMFILFLTSIFLYTCYLYFLNNFFLFILFCIILKVIYDILEKLELYNFLLFLKIIIIFLFYFYFLYHMEVYLIPENLDFWERALNLQLHLCNVLYLDIEYFFYLIDFYEFLELI